MILKMKKKGKKSIKKKIKEMPLQEKMIKRNKKIKNSKRKDHLLHPPLHPHPHNKILSLDQDQNLLINPMLQQLVP